MTECGSCGGLGRVAPGGITARFAEVFGGASVRECGQCQGIGEASPAGDPLLPGQRSAHQGTGLSAALPGEWRVEIHGFGRILAVLRFLLTHDGPAHGFAARCDYGGLPDWTATGTWTCLDPTNTIWLTGTQSSPYLLTTGYQWGATLRPLARDVLHGESISHEWTMWSRKATRRPEPSRAHRRMITHA